ncbi:MAG: glycosyltransferase [Desulfobacterales bacterium]|nr:glycosyltransferase [Desulfobacterales bacterium]
MKKIRIMHLIHELGAGGAENGIINQVNHINPNLFETSVCTFIRGGSQTGRLNRSRTSLFELGKKDGNDITLPFRLGKLLMKWKPHILHTHAWGTLCEGLFGAKLSNIPVIVHGEHGTIQQKKTNIYVQRLVWGFTDQVLSVSHEHAKELAATIGYPRQKIRVVINGVDTERFSRKKENKIIRDSLGIKKDDVVIGTLGRLVPVKNQSLLIKAFAVLTERFPNIKLMLVGDGPLKDDLTELANSLGLSSQVIFPGRRSDTPEMLNCMDIFALTSLSEGMSNTILEAMSSGLPVVATNVGGNPELVDDDVTGILVQSDNGKALADAFTALTENPDTRKDMGRSGRKRVENLFSLEAMVRNYEKLYLELYEKR